ncbi:MAG: response regulator [Gammaproteobacteria bacterium]|nr:response regulator [Gammaproteobacteria bacterium]
MKLLLVEDDNSLAAGLVTALAHAGYEIDHVTRAMEARQVVQARAYDVGVLDLGLPDGDGIELLRALRGRQVGFPILILTARDGLDDRVRGLDAGADDYLVKPFAVRELEARLRAMTRRHDSRLSPWRRLGALRVDLAGAGITIADVPVDLTARELAVLTSLMRVPGRIVNKETLFALVFPEEAEASDNALEVQVSRLRRKLEGAGVRIRALRGLGYRIEEADDGERS